MAKKKTIISRRMFLALTGGSGAGLMMNQGEKYVHKLIPYLNPPVYPKPGQWAFYTTTCRECPAGCGLLLWHRDGRCTKAEGHPENPINKGRLCIRGQSSVQGEYDPARLTKVLTRNEENRFTASSWDQAFEDIRAGFKKSGKTLLMSDLQTGSLAGVMGDFATIHHQKPLFYEPFNYESLRLVNKEMVGLDLIPRYKLDGCDLILAFGSDFLETWLSPVEYARQFAEIRDIKSKKAGRFVYVGSSETMTSINADDFILINPGEETALIMSVISELRGNGYFADASFDSFIYDYPLSSNTEEKTVKYLADCISKAHSPIILAGNPGINGKEGRNTVLAASILNELLGNRERIDFSQHHALSNAALHAEVDEFFKSISPGDTVIIHNANPVYSFPGAESHLKRAGKLIFLGNMLNETARISHWVLPTHYPLEDWGDYEAWKGTISLMQPTMEPLYETKSPGDIILKLSGREDGITFKELVQRNWLEWGMGAQGNHSKNSDNEEEAVHKEFFNSVLQRGFFPREGERVSPKLSAPAFGEEPHSPLEEDQLNLLIKPSLFFYDGRLANRPWLQEIPHPVSNIAWQSWLDMHPDQAEAMDIEEGDIVKVRGKGGEIHVPVRFTRHISIKTVAIEAGLGHTALGSVAKDIGSNAFSLGSFSGPDSPPRVFIGKISQKEKFLFLHPTKDQHDRELLRTINADAFYSDSFEKEEINWPGPEGYKREEDLYEPHYYKEHRWGMVVDLQKCIGCKACEAACYAENNIPTVGIDNLFEGREMSWLKIIPYNIEEGKTAFLPLPCQQCDAAPCEPVCPVYASVHTEEGLNAQIYNRCIGTRYCSNNCPYKVRRFNWSNIKHDYPATLQLNPEVTVRERGVMEKCTFCVQRIRNAEQQAKIEGRELRDGEIIPACQQTCPTEAIVFGDIMDEKSRVYGLMQDDRRYQVLKELNTKPAVVYLKKIRNT